MEITLRRDTFTAESTTGVLSINGAFECFTLEDVVRPVKVKGLTAIPSGIYEVVVTWSSRFERPLPLLLAVPNFDGIRIHPGNTAMDTEGCLLVGQTRGADRVGKSRAAFDALFTKVRRASQREKVYINITNEPPS